MKSKYLLRVISLLVLLASFVPVRSAGALPLAADPPPADMFQLPWDLGIAWVAIDGIDNGTRRPLNSSHHWSVGGAIDFAPHNNMRKGEDTSGFWVTAAASGTVVAKSFCHVKINHGNGLTTEYQFLANVSVTVGESVSRNQRIGIIADGIRQKFCPGSNEPNVPHLHFMLRPSIRNATLAGWEVNYLPILNKTTFRKHGQAVGLFKPLLNTFDQVQIVDRGSIIWDTLHTGNVDTFRYERWSLTLDDLTKFTLTATPTTSGLTPLILLLDSNGNEITRSAGMLTSTQPAGNYFVQIQPEAGSGSYTLLAHKDDLPSGPFVSTTVAPASVKIGQTAIATVRLHNVPAEGYASAEFTCTYNATLAGVGNIGVANLFGADPATAINDRHNGSFIAAIAGSQGNKATADGIAFTFNITGSQAGQTVVECQARVSKGDNVLTAIDFIPGSLTVLGSPATPTPSTPVVPPTLSVESPTITHSPTPDGSPTSTATATPVPSTPTVLPSVCDRAEFVAHVTVPNGTIVSPASTFTKTWRLKNLGPCTWTTSYGLVFFAGEPMGAVFSAQFPTNVAPGQTADFSINMTAPNAPGTYRGFWMFRNANGVNFGIGPDANEPWYVEISVAGPTLPPSLTPTTPPSSPTPTVSPSEPVNSPTPSSTPGGPVPSVTPTPASDWLTYINTKYWFQFLYPKEGHYENNSLTDNHARIILPFVPGTNLREKYLDVTVVENANPCQAPLATRSILETSETVVVNGITFLKQTGGDGTAGHINRWIAYSTSRDNACVSLELVLRAANPGVFPTPPPVYDEVAESAVIHQIIQTYLWLTPPTATPDESQTATPTVTAPGGTVTATATVSTPVESPTPGASPTPRPEDFGAVAGQVLASKTVTVSLFDANSTLIVAVETDSNGFFSFNAPAGTYTIRATVGGFLMAQGFATVTAGSTNTKPTLTLLAGDIDGNGVINQFDAMTIGMSYNSATPSEADLNNDGVINILDLERLADNYRQAGPKAWN